MTFPDSVLERGERIVLTLRSLYRACGYRPYRMSKFEEYDLYADNKDFLVSDNVITFTDIGGKLMALKPDVTLSIIKNSKDQPKTTQKVCYDENVYRVSNGMYKEILQTGVECFGSVGKDEICEVLTLAAKSLSALSGDAVLSVSDLDTVGAIIARLSLSAERQKELYTAIGEKNPQSVRALCAQAEDPAAVDLLCELLSLQGAAVDILPNLKGMEGIDPAFLAVLDALSATDIFPMLRVDFSVIGDVNYYNGIVFKGFLRDVPRPVLSGGQYDRLMQKLDRKSSAIGFAVYTDALDRVELDRAGDAKPEDGFVNIALPKGRLGEKVYALFAKAGFECPSILEPNRKLIFENPERGVRYFWVKPSDVSIYVERGAADIGVCGKDILLEYEPDIYELLDLKMGNCRMAVAGPKGFADDGEKTLRVATKFQNIARSYYRTVGRDIDIIHLNGSIEIAPILGLSDVIVDIVETGTTLRENNLEVLETVVPISARLIAGKAAYKFKQEKIEAIAAGLATFVEG